MEWQSVTTLVAVLLSAAYLIRMQVRKGRRALREGCADDCGCAHHVRRARP